MAAIEPNEITDLLRQIERGDVEAHNRLAQLVRASLKRIAANRLRRERPGHLYQTSDLVQEAYVRLFKIRNIQWQGREHFFKVAAMQMRRILVEYARHQRLEDGGQVALEDVPGLKLNADPVILRANEALIDLTKIDGRRALIAELKFFGGYRIEEIVEITGIPLGTVKRHWAAAKAFIKLQFGVSASTGADAAILPTLID